MGSVRIVISVTVNVSFSIIAVEDEHRYFWCITVSICGKERSDVCSFGRPTMKLATEDFQKERWLVSGLPSGPWPLRARRQLDRCRVHRNWRYYVHIDVYVASVIKYYTIADVMSSELSGDFLFVFQYNFLHIKCTLRKCVKWSLKAIRRSIFFINKFILHNQKHKYTYKLRRFVCHRRTSSGMWSRDVDDEHVTKIRS